MMNRMRGVLLTDNSEAVRTNRLKGSFLEKEKDQMLEYIKDLEETITINKQIISELLLQGGGVQDKKIIGKLNGENASLQMQLKRVIKERAELQAKLLIAEQILSLIHI
eukprot:TRINITY_DN38937_c0_g1_i1.p1 TRINITY_DN38937_c0_g1~~TRINITY_DN38937_c0_g1_i1.p1  ORF type:complete len:109 (-),score=28.62 TRINITY_DN38937_c0_g1_i1:96-422(-)